MKTSITTHIPSSDAKRWRRVLLSWYAEHKRELPWRDIGDPYKIWISEIILQQTRVVQGMDYYRRFIERFPTKEALAAASEDEVLQMWQGLGYYSRARNLHAAARQIAGQPFPNTYADIHQMKGVGDYTAAAIASFAFGIPVATVDGNVYRVLARHFGMDVAIDTTQGKKHFAQVAQTLLDSEAPAAYNQAMMDFGAMQCIPRAPQCEACPFVTSCVAFRGQLVDDLPVKSKKLVVKTRHLVYLYLRVQGKIWLHRREKGDIWQGLYEPLLLEFDKPVTWAAVVRQAGIPSAAVYRQVATQLKHVLTHRILMADAYCVDLDEFPLLDRQGAWVDEERRDDYAVPRLVELIYQRIDRSVDGTSDLLDA